MKILFVYDAGHQFTQAVYDYSMSFKKYSAHSVDFFNTDTVHQAGLDFSGYDALIVGYCVACSCRGDPQPEYAKAIVPALAAFKGIKIAIEQDPYDQTNAMKRFFMSIGANVILTVIPAEHVRYIYSESYFDDVRFETVLSGYLDDDSVVMPESAPLPLAERPIPLGYRGRETPWRIGDMGWHKAEIGHRFAAACKRRGIKYDIGVTEESRFHGEAWMHFVRSCRVMLGVPSGANIFDFDNSLHNRVVKATQSRLKPTYLDVREWIEKEKVPFDMGQVSPRVFEAVASRTALAMIEGRYSGVVEPEEHYIPVKADYSNIDEVLDRIQDLDAMEAMADRAYAHVIDNPKNHYGWFVSGVDGIIEESDLPRGNSSAPKLRTTDRPLGNDSWMVEQMFKLRRSLQMEVKQEVGRLMHMIAQERAVGYLANRGQTVHIIPQPGGDLWPKAHFPLMTPQQPRRKQR